MVRRFIIQCRCPRIYTPSTMTSQRSPNRIEEDALDVSLERRRIAF